jgi:hypothetical protein
MKVTDLRRKLLAALAAGGLLAPGAIHAAELNTNLVVNHGFENVDRSVSSGGLRAVKILDWTGGSQMGFAYSHNGALNGAGEAIPNYANGAPLAGGGSFYFTSNASSTVAPVQPDIDAPGQVAQVIDVSANPSGSLIASGNAVYSLSGFFNSFLDDGDFGTVQAEFRNTSSAVLGTVSASTRNLDEWTPAGQAGLIPVGTASVRISVFGTALAGGPDGYIDNVSFRIGNEVIMPNLELTINRDTGALTLSNRTGAAVNIKSYSITSEFGALEPANWRSIADNYDAGNPGPNQVDPAHQWSKLTDPTTNGDLSEAELQVAAGASLAHTRTINLGNAGAWIQNPTEDLVFQYISGNQIHQGLVNFTGHGGVPHLVGDLNVDGTIGVADWTIFRTNQHADLSASSPAEAYRRGDLNEDVANNHTDFVLFKTAFDSANGAGAFDAMVASIPEPSSMFLVVGAGLFMLPSLRPARPKPNTNQN